MLKLEGFAGVGAGFGFGSVVSGLCIVVFLRQGFPLSSFIIFLASILCIMKNTIELSQT